MKLLVVGAANEMSWLRWIGRLIYTSWFAQKITIDLRGVRSREDFQRELARHFAIALDHRDLWRSFHESLWAMENTGPVRLRFVGWEAFSQRMPRYARRVKQYLLTHLQLRGPAILTIVFD